MFQANFTVSPLTGFVLATEFTVTNLTTGGSVEKYSWDFGTNEVIYDTETPSYIYNYPGTYTITLTAINFDGVTSTHSQTITAEIAYRDYVRFTQIPERFPDPGKLTNEPFKFEVISSNPNKPLVIDLFASNSKSIPYQYTSERWVFLTPTWKFLDKNQTPVISLSVQSIPIYVNGTVVAVSGSSEFYYVDSSSAGDPTQNCPILITATLQTSGFINPVDSNIYSYESYANNKTARTGAIWQVNDLSPTLLKVTGNYVDDINPKQWTGIKIPVLVTAHSNRAQVLPGSEESVSEVIFSYPQTNTLGKLSPVILSLSGKETDTYTVDETPLYFQTTDSEEFRSGGYIFTTITGLTSVSAVSITAQTTAYTSNYFNSNEFPYPYGYAPNTSVWVSNPEKNTLNKITLIPDPGTCNSINYLRDSGVLADGTVKEVQVPSLSTTNTYNYTMSGFSGIYGIAVDPRNYELIAADAELDCLYRISNTGEILKTLQLSGLEDYNPYKKFFHSWRWKTPSPITSASRFAFYNPVPISPRMENYLITVGGYLQTPETYEINVYEGYIRFLSSPNYFPEGVDVEVKQIFHPALPITYLNSQEFWWVKPTNNTTTTFTLTGTSNLSQYSNYYIVTIDGVQQAPNTYTVNPFTRTITFSFPLPENLYTIVRYIPNVDTRTWIKTFVTPITSFSFNETAHFGLSGGPSNEPEPGYLVNIGGVLQSETAFSVDDVNKQIIFSEPVPSDTQIIVTQFTIPEKIDIPVAYTPAYVSLDKDYNIWVTLFNTVSVLKFDPDFNLLLTVAPSGIEWQSRAWVNNPTGIGYQSARYGYQNRYLSPSGDTIDIYTNEFFLKPPVVETDRDNNCWVTYSHPLCCMLVKYANTGQVLSQIQLSEYTTPINLAVNLQNNIWVSNYHGSSYTYTSLSGNLQLYDTNTSQVLKTVRNISRPGYIALDRSNNLWFTHGLRRIGYYNTTTDTLCAWTLELSGGFSVYTTPSSLEANLETFDELENEEDEELGGLAVDVYNRVWVLDSIQNFAWVISATPNFNQAPTRVFKIRPDVTLGYYVDINSGSTYTESGDYYYKSAQATGDWTGNRWYQKYAYPQALSAILVSGISTPFDITEFTNKHQIKRVNESFNTAEYYKSLALPEILNSNTVLFDKFFPATVGTGYLSANEDPGQVTYEKIANFVLNHSDIDTCNIDQLLSLAEETAVPASDYAAVYPTDIRNMLDIASIPRSKLWGIKDEVPILQQSMGKQYNIQTDSLTADSKIILKSKFDSSLSLLTVPPLSTGETIYSLYEFNAFGLINPTLNYLFYRFEPSYTGNYIENIIDWKSHFTTQTITASTLEEWYGDNGAIETAFRYLLTKNLFLK